MVAELQVLNEWIPEQMHPGTLFLLEDAADDNSTGDDPYRAVLACPACGTLGLITRRQLNGVLPIICGSDECSAHFFLRDSQILVRKPS